MKNKSKKVPNGTIVQTRDDYFSGQGKYQKPNYQNKGNYRKAVVVDSNDRDELALVKITSSGRAQSTKKGTKFRPHVLTKDNTDSAIKENSKFIIPRRRGKIKNKITSGEANEIKKASVNDKKHGNVNKKRLRDLKGRK